LSLPHWIKWNKDKGMYKISNSMECFEQKNKKMSKAKQKALIRIVDIMNKYDLDSNQINHASVGEFEYENYDD
jgi:hypothetical protein